MITPLQKAAAQAIVNVFETGRARGDYGRVTLLPGDTGHLTYGRAQTTLASGNLYLLIKAYVEAEDAAFADRLLPYLDPLARADLALDADGTLHGILRACGDDPVMRATQDAFFDRVYWGPAAAAATRLGLGSALGHGLVYDGRIHGSFARIEERVVAAHGAPATVGEEVWCRRYAETRRAWLAGHANPLLRRTVYRMDSFRELMDAGNWALALPFAVRGVVIDEAALLASAPVRASAAETEERLLLLRRPYLRGEDVRRLQAALKAAKVAVTVDGVFGPGTEAAVIAFQGKRGLTVDGVAGPATLAALGL